MNIRKLTIDDLDIYKQLRLELLENHPENFGSDEREEAAFDSSFWEKRLTNNYADSYGAFVDDQLVGMAVCVRNPRKKMKHFATISSIYVKPEFRGQGFAKRIIDTILFICTNEDLEFVRLSVVTENTEAINLYQTMGFEIYGTECRSIFVDGAYYDLHLMQKELYN
jgi:ribosomal protein S18 acetylase RimI-like enzyme